MPPTIYKMLLEYGTMDEKLIDELTDDERELLNKLKTRKFKENIPIWIRP
jgi:hypothetical protein